MDKSGEYIAWFVIFLFDVLLYIVKQAYITGFVALDNLRGELVYDNQMIVLE